MPDTSTPATASAKSILTIADITKVLQADLEPFLAVLPVSTGNEDTIKKTKIFDTCLISIFNACKVARDQFVTAKALRVEIEDCTDVLQWKDIVTCGTSTWDFVVKTFMHICDFVAETHQYSFTWSKTEDLGTEYLDFMGFRIGHDINTYQFIFARSAKKLRKKMMRQTMQVWVHCLFTTFTEQTYRNTRNDPYFTAKLLKSDIRNFLDPKLAKENHVAAYALPELCIAVKDMHGEDVDYRPQLVEFQKRFFPDDTNVMRDGTRTGISKLCKLVFRLRYWCAFDWARKYYEKHKNALDALEANPEEQYIFVAAAEMQQRVNPYFVPSAEMMC
jgi:hypothetical protein